MDSNLAHYEQSERAQFDSGTSPLAFTPILLLTGDFTMDVIRAYWADNAN